MITCREIGCGVSECEIPPQNGVILGVDWSRPCARGGGHAQLRKLGDLGGTRALRLKAGSVWKLKAEGQPQLLAELFAAIRLTEKSVDTGLYKT
jgi:hypothetical protein